MCLKWEALLAEGERPRAFGSMVVWVVYSSSSSGGTKDRQAGGGRTVRLMLSWEAQAVRAREKVGTAAAGVFWAEDDKGSSKRFGLSSAALGQQQVEAGAVTTGERALRLC